MPTFLERVKPNCGTLAKNAPRRMLAPMPTTPDKPFAEIGERLRWHRETLGLEQQEYVDATRTVKRSAYSNWEVGSSRLSLNGAIELCDAYGLSLDFLYFGNADTLPMALRNAWLSRSRVSS